MKWIGLTGSIGSGKSTVAKLLRESGYAVIDADRLAHDCLLRGTKGYEEVLQKFGLGVLGPDHQINRRALGHIIFGDHRLKDWLENLIHPLVREQVQKLKERYEKEGHTMGFYEVPLLFEKGLERQFDAVVVVGTSEDIQRSRLKGRNGWSDEEIVQRNRAQWPLAEKILKADFVLQNDGSLDTLKKNVTDLLLQLQEL